MDCFHLHPAASGHSNNDWHQLELLKSPNKLNHPYLYQYFYEEKESETPIALKVLFHPKRIP